MKVAIGNLDPEHALVVEVISNPDPGEARIASKTEKRITIAPLMSEFIEFESTGLGNYRWIEIHKVLP